MGMGTLRLVYLARDAARRDYRVDKLEDAGFEVVEGRPADGQALVEQVRPAGTVIDLPHVRESDVELICWLRNTHPWRDRPCLVSGVPPDTRQKLRDRIPGIRFVKGQVVDEIRETFRGQRGFKIRDGYGTDVRFDGDVMIV